MEAQALKMTELSALAPRCLVMGLNEVRNEQE